MHPLNVKFLFRIVVDVDVPWLVGCIFWWLFQGDIPSHQKLLHKLEKFGIQGSVLQWVKAFLSNRTQAVVVDNARSSLHDVTSGVPQGSVLGPLLFRIFVDDIVDTFKHSEVRLFADDTKLFLRFKRGIVCSKLLEDLQKVSEWASQWQLSLALTKCLILPIRGNH